MASAVFLGWLIIASSFDMQIAFRTRRSSMQQKENLHKTASSESESSLIAAEFGIEVNNDWTEFLQKYGKAGLSREEMPLLYRWADRERLEGPRQDIAAIVKQFRKHVVDKSLGRSERNNQPQGRGKFEPTLDSEPCQVGVYSAENIRFPDFDFSKTVRDKGIRPAVQAWAARYGPDVDVDLALAVWSSDVTWQTSSKTDPEQKTVLEATADLLCTQAQASDSFALIYKGQAVSRTAVADLASYIGASEGLMSHETGEPLQRELKTSTGFSTGSERVASLSSKHEAIHVKQKIG